MTCTTAYNVMQQAQGFDLKPYAGEICTQYLYKIDNYPDETEVYATLFGVWGYDHWRGCGLLQR